MVGVVERDGTGEGVLEHVRAATRRREVFSIWNGGSREDKEMGEKANKWRGMRRRRGRC